MEKVERFPPGERAFLESLRRRPCDTDTDTNGRTEAKIGKKKRLKQLNT